MKIKCEECGHFTEINSSYLTHKMSKTKFYKLWTSIKQRCSNPKQNIYEYYGGRGITVCDRWKNFLNFKEDMFDSYLEHQKQFGDRQTTLDRINNDGNYCKENCQWKTMLEQCSNRRPWSRRTK